MRQARIARHTFAWAAGQASAARDTQGRRARTSRPGRAGATGLARVGVEQLEGGNGVGQAGAGEVQVAHGGADMAVAEQTLDGREVDAGFDEVGGERMTKGIDAAVAGNTGRIAGGANRCAAR